MPAFGNLRQRLVAVGATAGIVLAVSVPLIGGTASAASPVTPVTTTILKDAVTNQPWSGAETTGATAYDTATLAGTDGPIPTGTVTYTYFTNGGCQGDGATESVALVDGVPPDASATDCTQAASASACSFGQFA